MVVNANVINSWFAHTRRAMIKKKDYKYKADSEVLWERLDPEFSAQQSDTCPNAPLLCLLCSALE